MTNIHSEALNSPCQLYIVMLSIRGIQQLTWNLTFETVTSPWFMAYNWISTNNDQLLCLHQYICGLLSS